MDYQDVLDDFARRMTPTEADRMLGLATGTVSAAIRRGEIHPYRFKDSPTRAHVTPRMLAEWLERHCRETEDAPTR